MRFVRHFTISAVLIALLALPCASQEAAQCGSTEHPLTMQVPGGEIDIIFDDGPLDLSRDSVYEWVRRAATAVSTYYGRFPVAHERLRIIPTPGRGGVFGGWTVGHDGGFTRIHIGEHTTNEELQDDWMLTHEFVHLGFPDMPREQHWIEEGMATYVEPVARVQAGQLKPEQMFHDIIRDMPKGEPQAGDQGLDNTHSWASTYWGGALFCLEADVEIRRATKNKKGLQDAFRAILQAGGNIDREDWSLERALSVGDEATGTKVLETLYQQMGLKPGDVNLVTVWKELGVSMNGDTVVFDTRKKESAMRDAILAKRPLEVQPVAATTDACSLPPRMGSK